MDSILSECEEFKLLKMNTCRMKSRIHFLKRCKQKGVLPKFTHIKCNTKSQSGLKAIHKARRCWLVNELRSSYAELATADAKSYQLYQKIASRSTPLQLDVFMGTVREAYGENLRFWFTQKRKKLTKLKQAVDCPKSEFIPNFLINKSSIELNEDEISLLNKGLNFALPNKQTPVKDIVVDTEAGLKYSEKGLADEVRAKVKKVFSTRQYNSPNNASKMYETIKSLNKKEVYVTKADKGNGVVVVDRGDYDDSIHKMIADGPYVEVKNPSHKISKACSEMITKHCEIFGGERWRRNMIPSYSKVPRIYGLPKIHKEGNKYRPIVDNTLAHSYKLSKFLRTRFAQLKQMDNFSIKNSIELTEKLKDVKLQRNEVLISFDISSYFTSVPVEGAL
ncbi:uncharacterized protein LOC116351341, partial [Contarinia nasturtii]|uniref:uncharacterized protein LOC116351341 n=1 Tax=Contarinia nasturtii TaxID=265458 RepID=UPI0012D46F1E